MNVHIFLDEKFVGKYIEFIDRSFEKSDHIFLILCSGRKLRFPGVYSDLDNVVVIHKSLRGFFDFVRYTLFGGKIIFHGVFVKGVAFLLGFKCIAKKTYVVLWGGDIYGSEKAPRYWNNIKHRLLSRCAGITCELEEDYYLACRVYNTNAPYFESMLYLSNVIDEQDFQVEKNCKKSNKINVLVGNSADPENNHFYLLEKLIPYAKNIKLIVPLSYGNQTYADEVEAYIKTRFESDSCILRTFLPVEEYKKILKSIDIAVFAHDRQQALGNTFQLLSFGAKVFIKENTTTYKWMHRKNIRVFSVDNLEALGSDFLKPMSNIEIENNREIIYRLANEKELYDSWKRIFDD